MQTSITDQYANTAKGKLANDILRKCVHCGFCNATCPTYQLLGDELDGPRGRIYLIKQLLEGKDITRHTQLHLDRCLICRSCETTCPSGVQYSRLLEIGKEIVDDKVSRTVTDSLKRKLFNSVLPKTRSMSWLLKLASMFKWALPVQWEKGMKTKAPTLAWPTRQHARKVLLLEGCVQTSLAPDIDRAAARVLDALEISVVRIRNDAGCCGAINQHLSASSQALALMKKNLDAWSPLLDQGVEAIVTSTSGCAPHLKDYAYLLAGEPKYAEKASVLSARVVDISELVAGEDLSKLTFKESGLARKVSYHSPCTSQHGQKLSGVVESLLGKLGYRLLPVHDSHLCCGAAGTYSIMQPQIAERLLVNKIVALQRHAPEVIATSNIGCLTHLESDASVPVKHWIELLAEDLHS